MKISNTILLAVCLFFGCSQVDLPIDNEATEETVNLYNNLKAISQNGFMFGHQDDQAYGVGWFAEEGRSDVLSAVGKYPAVHGWDLGRDLSGDRNIDSVSYERMKKWAVAAYERGGINTASFHMDNLTTGGNSWDRTPSVKDILPGGSKHGEFLEQLDLLADFFADCDIPFIFRPWHEHNGNWFWWGKGNCTEEEYAQLFRFTVDYLKNKKNIHKLLYAFSPDRSRLPLDSMAEQNYLWGYPGDEYVDIIGLDNYRDARKSQNGSVSNVQNMTESLKLITAIANKKNKVAALTETGNESIKNPNWFTEVILDPVKENKDEINIGWVLVWRNSNLPNHYYVPYGEHEAMNDFKDFEKDNMTLFESDLNGQIYDKPNL